MEDSRATRSRYRLLHDDGLVDSSPLICSRPYIAGLRRDGRTNDFRPPKTTVRPLASSPAVVTPNSRQSPIGREAHIVAEDIVIRHQKRGVNLVGKPGAQLTFGRDAEVFAADSVVQYGSDVTMWSRKSERATPKIGGFSR